MRDPKDLQRHFQLRHLTPVLLGAALCISSVARAEEPAPAPPPQKPRVLVLSYRIAPRIPVQSETADSILVARMSKVPAFSIINEEELKALADYQALEQQLGVDNVEALVRLGKAAQADRLVLGTMGDVGETTAATLVLINVNTAEVEKRVAGTAKGERDLILPLLNQQADALLAHLLRTYAPEKLGTARAPEPQPPAAQAAAAPQPVTPPQPAEKATRSALAKKVPGPRFSSATVIFFGALAGTLGFTLTSALGGLLIWAWLPELRPSAEKPGPLPLYALAGGVSVVGAGISAVALAVSLFMDMTGEE